MWAPASACDERRAHQPLDGRVVEDALAVEQAAVPVLGVLAEADVGDDDEVGHLGDDARARRAAPGPAASHAADPSASLRRRQPEQQHARRRRRRAPPPLRAPPRRPRAGRRPASTTRRGGRRCPRRRTAGRRADPADRRVSRTSARMAGVRRSRRGRLEESATRLTSPSRKCSTSAWTRPGTVYSVGTIVEVMPSCCAASAVTGPIDATTRAGQQVGRLLLAERLDEVPHRRRAGERHGVDLALEQQLVDVGIAFALRLGGERAVGDDVGDQGAGLAQIVGQHLARDLGAREQDLGALAARRARASPRRRARRGARAGSRRPSGRSAPASRPSPARRRRCAGP